MDFHSVLMCKLSCSVRVTSCRWCRGARHVLPRACLTRILLHRLWPYLGKHQNWAGRQKYSAKPITLSHDDIWPTNFCCLILGHYRCGLRYRASKSRTRDASYRHDLTSPLLRSPPWWRIHPRFVDRGTACNSRILPETYFLLVTTAVDAQARPFLQFQTSCLWGTL
jgi:hypothetical protein